MKKTVLAGLSGERPIGAINPVGDVENIWRGFRGNANGPDSCRHTGSATGQRVSAAKMAIATVWVIAVDKGRNSVGVGSLCLVHMRVVPNVADFIPCFVRAITRSRTAGELDWQGQHEKDE